jgi:ATP-dependent Clp protease ATP-binding subunit ClpA
MLEKAIRLSCGMKSMFERFTDRSRRVLVLAQEEARNLNHDFIGPEHILLGLIGERRGVASKALEALGVTLKKARAKVREAIAPNTEPSAGSPPFSAPAKKVLERSLREALLLGNAYIGTEHILLGLVQDGQSVSTQVLSELGAGAGRIRELVIQMMGDSAKDADTDAGLQLPANHATPAASIAVAIRLMGRNIRHDLDPAELEDHAERISREVTALILERWNDATSGPESSTGSSEAAD